MKRHRSARLRAGDDWMEAGVCAQSDPEAWFPLEGGGLSMANRQARTICRNQCPVKDSCLDHALVERISHGIWGGETTADRDRILAARRKRTRILERDGQEAVA